MITVNFIRTNNDVVQVKVPIGWTIMEAAKEADLDEIPADCGGCCACATCHVHIDKKWIDKTGKIDYTTAEIELLEYEKNFKEEQSRLSCQIMLKEEHDGIVVHLIQD